MWGPSAPTRPEPLETVWRGDTDIEWGMVVLDITNLSSTSADTLMMRYGIVGFKVGMAKFIASREANFIPPRGASFEGEHGPLRVIEEVRPRRAMSAAEYMAKFKYEDLVNEYTMSHYNSNMDYLAPIPLVPCPCYGQKNLIQREIMIAAYRSLVPLLPMRPEEA